MTQKAPLFTIRPDPDQPRNLLPPDLIGLFTNGLMSPQAIMAEWQKSPNSQFVEIVRLADSIAQHGQINPISVRVAKNNLPGVEYMIVTGERRWWAHVLLWTQGRNIMEGDTRGPADQIKISLVTKGVSIRALKLRECGARRLRCCGKSTRHVGTTLRAIWKELSFDHPDFCARKTASRLGPSREVTGCV